MKEQESPLSSCHYGIDLFLLPELPHLENVGQSHSQSTSVSATHAVYEKLSWSQLLVYFSNDNEVLE